MTRDEVIRMATEAGLLEQGYRHGDTVLSELERFATLVAAAERENLPALIARAKQEAVAAHIAMFCDVERAVADEREACAIACEVHAAAVINDGKQSAFAIAHECASAIRARGSSIPL